MPIDILSSVDLLENVADNTSTRADLSALGRCSRALHEAVLPRLYRDIEFSIYKVDSLAAAMRSNDSLSRFCRKLSVTTNGAPNEHQERPLGTTAYHSFTEQETKVLLETEQDIIYVMTLCIEQGNLTHLSWAVGVRRLRDTKAIWKNIHSSRLTLKSVLINTSDERYVHAALEAMSGCCFPDLSIINLRVWLSERHLMELWRFLAGLPSLNVLDLSLTVLGSDEDRMDGDTFIPDIKLERLESLSVVVDNDFYDRDFSTYPEAFVRNQPALVELTTIAEDLFPHGHIAVLSPTLRALDIREHSDHPPHTHSARTFHSLTTLRIRTNDGINQDWKNFVNELPHLKCIEIFQSAHVDRDGYGHKEYFAYDVLDGIREGIVEYHAIYQYYRVPMLARGTAEFGYSQQTLTSTKRLDDILASCSGINSIRAICVSYRYNGHDESTEVNAWLPDEHVLNEEKIPRALEYVRWEVPWASRLYEVVETDESIKLVYLGCDSLADRRGHSSLTWTNETIFDYVKC